MNMRLSTLGDDPGYRDWACGAIPKAIESITCDGVAVRRVVTVDTDAGTVLHIRHDKNGNCLVNAAGDVEYGTLRGNVQINLTALGRRLMEA